MTTTGTSNVIPNAMNIVSTNDRYLSMSVIICTPTGAVVNTWIALDQATRQSRTTTTAMMERISRLRSSTRCEMKVSCVLSGLDAGSVIRKAGGTQLRPQL